MEDSKAIQQFALRLRQTKTNTILEKYPVEFFASDISLVFNSTNVHRGTKTLIATISSIDGRAITSDLLATINIPNVTIETLDENGTIKIYATSNTTTAFDVAPVIKGNNIENGQIAKDSKNITVDEVKTVTDISFFDQDGNEIKDELKLTSGQAKVLNIKYYHTYEDGTKVELTEENTSATYFDVNKVKLQQLPTPTIFDRNYTVLVNSADNPTTSGIHFIHALNIQTVLGKTGNENLTITINNDITYSGDYNWTPFFTKVLKVTVADEQVTKLKIDNEIKDDGDSFDLNLYKVAQTNNPNVYYDKATGHYFTIFNINLISNGTTGRAPLTSPIISTTEQQYLNDVNSFIISQDSDPELSFDLDVKYFKLDSTTGEYTPIEPGATDIEYIGISYFDDYDTNIGALSDGLTLHFGGTKDSNGNVVKEHVYINIKGVETDLGVSGANKAPAATQTPEAEETVPTTSPEPTDTTIPSPSDDANEFDEFDQFVDGTDSNLVAPTTVPISTPTTTATASPEPTTSTEPEVSEEPNQEITE